MLWTNLTVVVTATWSEDVTLGTAHGLMTELTLLAGTGFKRAAGWM